MKKTLSGILGLGLSAVIVAGSFVPAQAMPIRMAPIVSEQSNNGVTDVQYRRHDGPRPGWNGGQRPRPGWNGGPRPRPGWNGGPRPRPGWHGGYQGSRQQRPGYRRHSDGYWFPLAAFATGAILGGALSQQNETYRGEPEYRPRPVYGLSQAHINWCSNRYRSYDRNYNTFQPYNGPRQVCYSPYN